MNAVNDALLQADQLVSDGWTVDSVAQYIKDQNSTLDDTVDVQVDTSPCIDDMSLNYVGRCVIDATILVRDEPKYPAGAGTSYADFPDLEPLGSDEVVLCNLIIVGGEWEDGAQFSPY